MGDRNSYTPYGDADLQRERYLEAVLQRADDHGSADVGTEWGKLLQRFRPLWRPPEHPNLLDLGCGIGNWSHYLATEGWTCYAVDRNTDFLRVGRRRGDSGASVHFVASLAEQLPFPDKEFDFCLARYVLEHAADWRATLFEVSRVLKPGGALFIGTANILCPFQDEVRYFPFFPYLPFSLKKRALKVIVDKLPALVNHSLSPAQNWFTPTGLRNFLLRECGYRACYDLIDMISPEELSGRHRMLRPLLPPLKRSPHLWRNLIYVLRSSIVLFAIKGD